MTLGRPIWLLLDIAFEWFFCQVVWKLLQRGHRWSWPLTTFLFLVAGVSFKCTQNPRHSCSKFLWIPRALSIGRLSVINSWLLTTCLISSSGIAASNSLSLHMNFVRWNISVYLLNLTSHSSKSFFSKFLEHPYHILLDYVVLFFWEHSYCSLVKKHHQKHEHASHDPLYFYWRHCLSTTGIARSFCVFLQPSCFSATSLLGLKTQWRGTYQVFPNGAGDADFLAYFFASMSSINAL